MEIIAFIGPSGTGKSHRAVMVAHQCQANLIIDDGLLIKGNLILGGISAKRQPTKMGAVKTALFTSPSHQEEAKKIIMETKPEKILILGTSTGMAETIARRLDLPAPKNFIFIENIASPKEIEKALSIRAKYSKHVIPAPIAEVKKSLPGSLIDPLHTFFQKKDHQARKVTVEQSVVRPHFNFYGKFSIAEGVILVLARIAAEKICPGSSSKIKMEQLPDALILHVGVAVPYGVFIPALLGEIQIKIREEVELYTGLYVKEVNITAKKIK